MKLRQIADINAGYPFRGKIPVVPGSGVVAVQMKDITTQKEILWENCTHTELTAKREPYYLQPGDILVAARGNHYYAVIIRDEILQAGFQTVAAPHFFMIRVRSNNIIPEYLAWFLNQRACQGYLEQNAEGTLTKSIRRSVLEDVTVVMPDLAKQRSIINLANILGQEKKIVEGMLRNSERLMNIIANDLLSTLKQ
ncbi:MAG: restriction endonuclease subunit S [Gammaproteobacteria bacterium]|nr:restriction endonuclease subunit S [Gammaproteobacteria bacterium]